MPPGADTPTLRARLDAGLAAMDDRIGTRLDEASRAALIAYLGLLERWNRAYNLTAVRDPEQMVPRHLLDSLAVLPWVTRGPVLDLGTGAGLPGIPLAIARPKLGFTLIDSNGKKTRFVRQAVLELGLENVEVIQARLEAYQPEHKFATIVARALAPLPSLYSGARALATEDARLLALKGSQAAAELAALVGDQPAAPAATPAAIGPGSQPASDATGPARSPSPLAASSAAPCIHRLVVPGVDGERSLIEVPLGSSIHG